MIWKRGKEEEVPVVEEVEGVLVAAAADRDHPGQVPQAVADHGQGQGAGKRFSSD